MNAFASASHAHGLMIYPAIPLGCAVPALIYALTTPGAASPFTGTDPRKRGRPESPAFLLVHNGRPHDVRRKRQPPATGDNAPELCLLCGPIGLPRRRREGRPYQPPPLTLPTPAPPHSSPFPMKFVSIGGCSATLALLTPLCKPASLQAPTHLVGRGTPFIARRPQTPPIAPRSCRHPHPRSS